jgi:hypothetical protein
MAQVARLTIFLVTAILLRLLCFVAILMIEGDPLNMVRGFLSTTMLLPTVVVPAITYGFSVWLANKAHPLLIGLITAFIASLTLLPSLLSMHGIPYFQVLSINLTEWFVIGTGAQISVKIYDHFKSDMGVTQVKSR